MLMHLLLGALLLLETGSVTYYNHNVMENVYNNRLAWGHVEPCPECIGMVALEDVDLLGQHVWLQRPGLPIEGPFLTTDVGTFLTSNRVAEVDYVTARRWHMAGPLAGVRVYRELSSNEVFSYGLRGLYWLSSE